MALKKKKPVKKTGNTAPRLRTTRTIQHARDSFLAALAETGNITRSCQKAKVPRQTAYDWKHADADFAQKWEAAVELGVDALEDEATRRAKEGTDKPVFHQGEQCGTIREFSDTLMVCLLKARRPDKFKERSQVDSKVDVTTHGSESIQETIDFLEGALAPGSDRKASKPLSH